MRAARYLDVNHTDIKLLAHRNSKAGTPSQRVRVHDSVEGRQVMLEWLKPANGSFNEQLLGRLCRSSLLVLTNSSTISIAPLFTTLRISTLSLSTLCSCCCCRRRPLCRGSLLLQRLPLRSLDRLPLPQNLTLQRLLWLPKG